MAVLEIARMGHPVLVRTAQPVVDPCEPAVAALVDDMIETMIHAGGVGLAAPQVKQGVQVVVFEVPPSRTADGCGLLLTTLINPVIEPLDDSVEEAYEACLSLPGLIGRVPRWLRIGYRGFGLDGKVIEREATGFHARVVQHECDHLSGTLYPRRMRDLSSFAFTEELQRLATVSAEEQ